MPQIVVPENEFAQVLCCTNHLKQGVVAFFLNKKPLYPLKLVGATGTPHGCLLPVFGNLCDRRFETLHNRLKTHPQPTWIPMKTYKIACIPGDGIGKEVVPAGQAVFEALATAGGSFAFDFKNFGWGGDWYRAHGEMMPQRGLDELRGMDAILFGSAGDPHIPDHITLWGLRLKICQGFDQYANVRPTRILPGIDGPLKRCKPEDLNWVIVRENSEGEYAGVGGRAHQGHPIEVATDLSVMTRAGVERIMRYAFKLAQSRPRKLLTVVTKSNAQRHAMVMWDEIAREVSHEFPDVTWDKELVDACTARMVMRPATLDTVVATNLHADILSDLAAALAGSLGIAPTANIDPERRYPSMFEPIHGSAFDIMGKGLANPVGTFWSCVMLLEHLGEQATAQALMAAIERVTANPTLHTRDLGGMATTAQVTQAVCAQFLPVTASKG
jgi:tartrate dehydrogenase/decarboxylase/D-malate dehydrogenase